MPAYWVHHCCLLLPPPPSPPCSSCSPLPSCPQFLEICKLCGSPNADAWQGFNNAEDYPSQFVLPKERYGP